ncbi:MAG: TonB-dependent receptor domain-containing protein [Planctomycetota bacterium]|jgi:TonB-linked SusC/RagA family outer membrane protein
MAGEGARIRIRGAGSLAMSNEPVVYVDGVRIDNAGGFGGGQVSSGNNGGGSRLDDINPDAIERIEILKGAAAATLYGSEASAGVIQIFTKRGQTGAPRFNFRIDQGIQNIPGGRFKPQTGFARDQAQADKLNTLFQNGALTLEGVSITPYVPFSTTPVEDIMETGRDQTYSANVSGGGEDVQYYVAGRANFEDGIFGGDVLGPAQDFNRRYQGNVAVTLFPRDRLQFRVSGSFTDTRLELPNGSNNIFGVVPLALDSKPEVANCDASSPSGEVLGKTIPLCTGAGNSTGDVAFMTVREAMQQETVQDVEHFNGNVTLSYEATQSVNLELTMGLDATNDRSSEFAPFGYDVDEFTSNRTEGFKDLGTRNHREITVDLKTRWNERFADIWASNFVLGGQGFLSKTKVVGGFGSAFPGPGLEVAGAASNQSLDEEILEKVNAGFFFQEQLGFKDFVFFTVGARYDRNSAFGEETAGEFYPKASLSIIPSDMSGWASSLLSTFRIRGAIGQSGLQPGAFDKLTTFEAAPTTHGPGVQPDNLGNALLKPEKSTEWETGAEFGLLNNRLGVDVTYWNRVTRDALVARQFPVTGGFQEEQLDNIGELKGEGLEVKFDALVMDRENLTVTFFANASYIKETITSMGPAPPLKVGGSYPRYRNFLMEGFAPGQYFGAQLVDFTPGQTVPYDSNGDGQPDTEAEFRAYLTSIPSHDLDDAELGPLMRDDDGDGDRLDHDLGKPNPDWTGAFGTQITISRNLQVNTLFEYKAGNYGVSNLTDAFRKSHPGIGRNILGSTIVESTLMNPATQNDADARLQAALDWATQWKSLNPWSGLNLVESGNYLRWNELSVTYSPPLSFAEKLGLDNMSFSVTGRNLVLWTGYSGIDPESNQATRCGGGGEADLDCNFLQSVDAWGVPLPVQWAISVRFGF